jgi:HSP20 family protein
LDVLRDFQIMMRNNRMLRTLRYSYPSSPFVGLNRLDSLFDRLVNGEAEKPQGGSPWRSLPISVWQDEKSVYLEAELPGVLEKDLSITVHEGVLTLKAEKQDQEGRNYLHNGRAFGNFEHAISLPEQVDSEKVEASLSSGVLTVVLPKAAQAVPRKISLKAS